VILLILMSGSQLQLHAQNSTIWSWQQPQSKVTSTGDLEWAPSDYQFNASESVRYIDFQFGDDSNDGLSKRSPWKHHPWDDEARFHSASCKGAHTYVFKQGVDYRGELTAKESGTPESPIILTRDPSWGEGPAVICGSEAVTQWKKGASNKLIPDAEKVWCVDLTWSPRCVWMIGKDRTVTRIPLARTPNWQIKDPDDIQSEWWTWKNPEKKFDNFATINGQQRHLAFDKQDINESKPQEYYENAIVWTTKGWVMGHPFPAKVQAVDRKKGSLVFPCQWGGAPSFKIVRGCRYYLEDKPQYLDSPGEFWFEKTGNGGRLHIRLPDDTDPNTVRIEVAKRIHMIDSMGTSHLQVRGLTFRFTNVYWNLAATPYWVSQESIDVEPGCIRLLGSGHDIEVSHCRFEHIHKGVRIKAVGRQDAIDRVKVNDNVLYDADSGGIELADSTTYGDVDAPMGRLGDVQVMRNKFSQIGIRPDLYGQGAALVVKFAQTVEIAGNFFHRICGQGIDVYGSKASRVTTDKPFTRILIHHNKAIDTLLNNDDFGGIETWQGGPAYVYNNISGNPGGYRNWDHVLSPETEDRFGHAFYLDGAFKNYLFNNIAWGKSKGPAGKLANTSALQEIISHENSFFNNTVYNFVRATRRQAPQAGRNKLLGNVFQSMGMGVFRNADPGGVTAGNEADAGVRRNQFALETNAYARNVFYDIGLGEGFGIIEPTGRWHKTFDTFRKALEKYKPLASAVGVIADRSPLRDPAAHDFRPSRDSAAKGLGAKVFVPWSLYETVAEWHFCPIPGDPTRIMDEHWCMSPYHTVRDDYYTLPMYPLKGINISLKDYQTGPLENWTTGSLVLNGRDQYAKLTNEAINRTVELKIDHAPQEWVTITCPKAMQPGKTYEISLQLHGVKDGLKLGADLHWNKKDGQFAGSNAWGGPPQDVKGPGPYQFKYVPVEKTNMGSFVITAYLTPTGDWKDSIGTATYTVPIGSGEGPPLSIKTGREKIYSKRVIAGAELRCPQIHNSNFLIEAYFKAKSGNQNATLIQKLNGIGFALQINQNGGVTLTSRSANSQKSLESRSIVNDDKWHHVVAEADRMTGTFTIYLDGKIDCRGQGVGAEDSLANGADLYVGGTPEGGQLNGSIEFLRLARGTLADSKTTIEELYSWEFDGPFLYDFNGHKRPLNGGEAGAIDAVPEGKLP
jgi:Concanavalin A-like lectin/glucanases superfamily